MAKAKKRINSSHSSHARRALSYVRSGARKKARREALASAHARNLRRGYTGWDVAKARRAARLGRATAEQTKILTSMDQK